MGKLMRALGLMSGTSLDGIDVALIDTDGEIACRAWSGMTMPIPRQRQVQLRAAIEDAKGLTRRDERPGASPHVERELTEQHADAVSGFLRKQGIARREHRRHRLSRADGAAPARRANGVTVQLGDGPCSRNRRVAVVFDLRAADVATGGQGAPLVPVYHRALVGTAAAAAGRRRQHRRRRQRHLDRRATDDCWRSTPAPATR